MIVRACKNSKNPYGVDLICETVMDWFYVCTQSWLFFFRCSRRSESGSRNCLSLCELNWGFVNAALASILSFSRKTSNCFKWIESHCRACSFHYDRFWLDGDIQASKENIHILFVTSYFCVPLGARSYILWPAYYSTSTVLYCTSIL